MKELTQYPAGAYLKLTWDVEEQAASEATVDDTVEMESEYPEARVLVILTGGTMCMRPSPEGLVTSSGFLQAGMAPMPCFNDGSRPAALPVMMDASTRQYLPSFRTPVSTYCRHVRYTLYEFPTLLDSSSISSKGWAQIAQTVYNNYALFDGFVIIHGTDSLAYTCSALSFMLCQLGKPVIFTGSQASIYELQTDATGNLLGSLILAGTFMIPEVCLFFHHRLFRGNRTNKIATSSFDAFASPNCEPLAKLFSPGAEVNWPLIRRPTTIAKFSIQINLDTAHVACLRLFPGIKPSMVDGVLRVPSLRGLVLETFGAGNAPEGNGEDGSLIDVIQSAVSRGIVIVNVSQCRSGAVSPLYALGSALGKAGAVFGQDLTTEAALTKLSYLLALDSPPLAYEQLVAQMSVSIRGEMTSSPPTQFAHPRPPDLKTSAGQQSFTALGYAISRGDVTEVRKLLENELYGLLEMRDYAGNSVLHLAAGGPDVGVVRELMLRGASVHVRNLAGDTPLGIAKRTGKKEIGEVLEGGGAMLHVEERERMDGVGHWNGVIKS